MTLKPTLLSLPLILGCAGSQAAPSQQPPTIAPAARQHFMLSSRDLACGGLPYRLFVARPVTPPPAGGYPVLYMLDGNGQFPLAVNGYQPADGAAPLIVAIGYPQDQAYPVALRTRDYTFAAEGEKFRAGGGAEPFYRCLQQQILPAVNASFPVNQRRTTLAGHSFGGLFTLYVLFNHPQAFRHYVANSPSLWWGNGAVIPDRQPLLSFKPASVTLSAGELEQKPRPGPAADSEASRRRQATLAARQQVTRAKDVAQRLRQEGVNSTFILFAGQDHGSVVPDAVNLSVRIAGQAD